MNSSLFLREIFIFVLMIITTSMVRYKKPKENTRGTNQEKITKKQVKDMLRSQQGKVELKMLDTNTNASAIDFSGTLFPLTDIPQGVTSDDRTGDRVLLNHLEIRWNLGVSSTDTTNLMRVMIVQYHPSATPFTTTFLQNTGSGAAPISQYNKSTAQDYRVVYDSGPINLVIATDYQQRSKAIVSITGFQKLQVFNTASASGSNQMYLMAISDSGAAAHPTLSFNARFFYQDA